MIPDEEPTNAPSCNLCSARVSTHRCYVCGRFVCDQCIAPCRADRLSALLTDKQTDGFFESIQVRCARCGPRHRDH